MYISICVLRYYQYLFMHVYNILFTNHFHMANNLVKWWKNKFLGGYRQFSGIVTPDCSEGRPSDTEELLRQTSTRTTSSQTVPSTKPVRQEFSYDVSVEGGISHDGHEKQEFSFTWYDFDGHGKITKDDIAGLVTTIYDTLGTSITVPHYGSKTIKVRLTVSPGQRKEVCEENMTTKVNHSAACKESMQNNSNPSAVQIKRDINVTIRKARNLRRARRKMKVLNNEDRLCHDRSLDNNDEVADISDDAEDDGCSRLSHTEVLERTSGCAAPVRGQNNFQHENTMRMRRIHKRSGSLQRQELFDIIQANMAKNNLGFQISSRKHLTNQSLTGNDFISNRRQQRFYKEQEHTALQRTHTVSTNIPVDNEHCTTPKVVSHCCYDKMVDSIVHHKKNVLSSTNFPLCSQENHCGTEKDKKCCDTSNLLKMHERTMCSDSIFDNLTGCPTNGKFCNQTPLMEQQSPHHLKHRNRQENHARAMEQVVRWLEQEFSSNLKIENTPPTEKPKPENKQSGNQSSSQNKKGMTITGNSVVEHHHVHEHIHHHYHHFQESPILV